MAEQSSDLQKELIGAARETSRASRFTLIAGPTASGKSALAMRMAEERDALIVNADSMQVYREFRILTARPSPVDEMRVPHRLYGFRPAREAYSVADWLADMAPLVAAAREGGRPLVIVGGTGLYFKALLEGLSPVPDIPDAVRLHWRREAERGGPALLYRELARRDPVMAGRLKASDPQRLVRALEVLDGTGRSLSEWHRQDGEPLVGEEEAEKFYLAPPRAELYARCGARLDQMVESGAIEEVRHLMSLDLPPGAPVLRALCVGPLAAHLCGELDFSAALDRAKTETRRYVKRQLTWARRNMISWNIVFCNFMS